MSQNPRLGKTFKRWMQYKSNKPVRFKCFNLSMASRRLKISVALGGKWDIMMQTEKKNEIKFTKAAIFLKWDHGNTVEGTPFFWIKNFWIWILFESGSVVRNRSKIDVRIGFSDLKTTKTTLIPEKIFFQKGGGVPSSVLQRPFSRVGQYNKWSKFSNDRRS